MLCEIITAQNFNLRTFTTRDGLPHNDIRSVAVDSMGFLWIATWEGLSRYDGYTFKNYYHDPDDSLSIPYFSVFDVQVDGGNNVWIMTDVRTIAKYDRFNDVFIRIDIAYESIPETLTGLSVDDSGYVWFTGNNKTFRFDFKRNTFNTFNLLDSDGKPKEFFPVTYDCNISVTENNRVWFTATDVYEFEIVSEGNLRFRNFYKVARDTPLNNLDFSYFFWYKLYISATGKKWMFSNEGLFLLDTETGVFWPYKDKFPGHEFPGNGFLSWSWHQDGIYIYDRNKAILLHIPHENCQLVRNIYCQNKDLIWFSNNSMSGAALGLNSVIFTPAYFDDYPVPAEKNDIAAVYAVTRDKNGLTWVGMRGKDPLIRISKDLKVSVIKIPEFKALSPPGAIRSITPSPEGIWIGFFRELLLFYDYSTGEFTRFFTESGYYRPVAVNKEGDLILTVPPVDSGRLIIYSPKLEKTIGTYSTSLNSPIYKILIDKTGIVWGGQNMSSILRFDPGTGKTETITLTRGKYNVEDVCMGKNGNLWLALLGGGVCNFDPATGRKTFYTTSDGLVNNMTYSILMDKTGNLWVSTNTGISRINPETGKIRNFGLNEGLNIIEFNSGAAYACANGEFLMGGMGGLVGFFPDSINLMETESGSQKAMITEIRVSGVVKKYSASACGTDTVTLKKGENNFKIFYSSSDFVNSDKTVYRYKLSGINNDWIETDSRNRNISFANLNPGWYDFKLQATDRSGSWSAVKELKIRILPYYYQTLLFKITVPVVFLLVLSSVIFVYIRQLKQRESQKQAALRLQSLRGQMNPHFIFNSLNSINYFISNNDKLSANRYIADFSKLIRSILHNLSHDFISLEKEIESVEDYLKIEYLRFGDKFDYNITVAREIVHENIKISPGMIQPFIENAIWHGVRGLENRKGKIDVWFGLKNEQLTCIIKDDGIGRTRAEMLKPGNDQKKSKGISIVLERLKIINGLQGSHYQVVITDQFPDRHDTGTQVVIDIPVVKEWS